MELNAYFQSYEDYFWQWESDEDVPDAKGNTDNNLLSVPGYGAIAYRVLVEELLNLLQPNGLPPFGSFLMMLAACQKRYEHNGCFDIIRQLPQSKLEYIEAYIREASDFIHKLEALPSYIKQGQNRVILFQTLLKSTYHMHSPGSSEILLRKLAKRPYKLAECAQKKPLTEAVVLRDIRFLALLDKQFPTTGSIIKAVEGILAEPELEEELIEEAVGVDEDKDFIQQLIEEPKTFQVGSLIKRIWSGLKIPMRHLSPGEQPIGGISDMTNKGELHRMLLSEFANEEEVFLSRVANNEALYIQREIPPEENIFERVLLIDASLKNWGTPKILAFAAALAIVKHPKANTTCKVFILGETFREALVNEVQQVIESLNQVSPVLEVSGAMHAFFEAHADQSLEVFLLTHEENLEVAAMQQAVQEHRDQLKYIVTTSLAGELNIFAYNKGTKKQLQKMVLPLEELWVSPPIRKDESNKKAEKKKELSKNYPLLFPAPKDRIAYFIIEGTHYLLSTKKQLLKTYVAKRSNSASRHDLYRTHRGFEVLFEAISIKHKGCFALGRNDKQELVLCQYQADKKLLFTLNLVTKEYVEYDTSLFVLDEEYRLMSIEHSFYLYHEEEHKVFKIPARKGPLETAIFSREFTEALTHHKNLINNAPNYAPRILKNVHTVGINKHNRLVLSHLELSNSEHDSLTLRRNNFAIKLKAVQYRNQFTFGEGSKITSDARGMLIFNSADKKLPEFYIPCSEYGYLAIATSGEFGGSDYYIREFTQQFTRSLNEMYAAYLEPFIQHIVAHGTED
ncbi:MAG: hypothetical protein JNM21_13335 [Taibaiella sp.]|nr:hypothetical protein [Taibaiella sp.]